MTTVDVRIRNEMDDTRWTLSNGLTGPASKLSHAIFNELVARRVEAIGSFNCAEYAARLKGHHLTEIMDGLDLSGWLYAASSDPQLIVEMINPEADYVVTVIEF